MQSTKPPTLEKEAEHDEAKDSKPLIAEQGNQQEKEQDEAEKDRRGQAVDLAPHQTGIGWQGAKRRRQKEER